ncbi:protein kinase [Gemmatimonadota bacterium]
MASDQNIEDRLTAALADRYQIEGEIGSGGMATVYLAQDLKHNRKVAVKVLKPELAAVVGAERFLAEIETTANLTHPHILPLHDSGEADSFLFYVMPYVEGETLRERLDQEQQLPVDEAVRIASDLAEALDYAHRHGVVHRDIKPANILMHEGRPLIADFGIALAVGSAGGARLTETGLSVGTPFYMSPEQATGDQVVGPSSDTYALACVLYEMLVGEPPYVGATAQAVLGKIISGGAVFAKEQRGSIPANVDAAIRKALEKLPADRFPSAQGLAEALADSTFRHGERTPGTVGAWKRISIATTTLAALFALAFGWMVARPETPEPTTRISVYTPEARAAVDAFDISADGTFMVYAGPGASENNPMLWLRRWDALDATPIRDTESNRLYPAISPDGQEVAFYDGTTIRVVPLRGGMSRSIGGDSLSWYVLRWGPEGRWVYFQDRSEMILHRVPSAGGPLEQVARFEGAADLNTWFDILPSGQGAVIELTIAGNPTIHALDLETGETRALTDGRFPRYANGQLLFVTPEGGTLLRAPFDPDRMVLTGTAVPVAEEILVPRGVGSGGAGWVSFAASETGRLLYASGTLPGTRHEVVWVTREGVTTPIDPDWTFATGSNNRGLSLSPDGTRLAISTLGEDGNLDVWLKELPQGPESRLTFDPAQDVRPRWTPDGQSVTFISERNTDPPNAAVYSKRASGTGDPVILMDHDLPIWEAVCSPPDMEWILGRTGGASTDSGDRDVWAVRSGTDSVTALVVTDFDEKAISFSPDGRFLLYESDETGRNEVYVRPFPNVEDGKWTVSTNGGVMPLWSHGGSEIFFVDAENRMNVATVETSPTFRVANWTTLFELPENILFRQVEQYTLYDLAPDDGRFIMFRAVESGEVTTELIFVQNWIGELEERLGGGR